MTGRLILFAIGLPLLATMVGGSSLSAQEDVPGPRTIRVQGEGVVTVTPNQASIEVGVVTQAETAGGALRDNSAAVGKLLAVLKDRYKIPAKDLQTLDLSIRPRYAEVEAAEPEPSRIVGYVATNQVLVKVRKLSDLGSMLDAAVSAGGNRISDIQFEVEDARGLLDEARRKAIADARTRATLYAEAAGVRVGKVVSIAEISEYPTTGGIFGGGELAMASVDVPIEAGEQRLTAQVQVVFELLDVQP